MINETVIDRMEAELATARWALGRWLAEETRDRVVHADLLSAVGERAAALRFEYVARAKAPAKSKAETLDDWDALADQNGYPLTPPVLPRRGVIKAAAEERLAFVRPGGRRFWLVGGAK